MSVLEASVQAVRTIPILTIPVGATATTATAAISAQIVRLTTDIGVNLLWGASPTAATTDEFLAAGVVEYKKVISGEFLSAITATGTAAGVLGTVFVSEVVE